MIDVKDQWPELFVDSLPSFAPGGSLVLVLYGERVLRNATAFARWHLALEWALNTRTASWDRLVPLTSPQRALDGEAYQLASSFLKEKGISLARSKVVFVGTHSAAFDMSPVVAAAQFCW